MCGIAGMFALGAGARPPREALERMAAALRHRGPDEEGFYQSGPIGLAHRRLSIIDLAAGQQPMQSERGDVCLVFNGEIYNHPELRESLERDGFVFRTRSDTEVLLACYLRHGLDAFAKLNGMFACAIWDSRTRKLVLARDRLGKKPLYYHPGARTFSFASELKALLAGGVVERKVDELALHDYLSHGYIAGERAIIAGVKRLPPAHLLVVGPGGVAMRRYWQLQMRPAPHPPSEEEAADELHLLLERAVRRRLVSDVPLGAFLSGGLDSSAVVAMMARLSSRPVRTFTVGFEEAAFSELTDARRVAQHLGTEHHELIVRPKTLELLPRLVWHCDEPFGDSSALPTWQVCEAAREHVTVALSGDGGDEVFAGYTHYQTLARDRRLQRLPAVLRRTLFKRLAQVLPFTLPGWNTLYALGNVQPFAVPSGLGVYPFIRERLYTREFSARVQSSDPFAAAASILRGAESLDAVSAFQLLDSLHYLPGDILVKVDRMSMAHGLEVRSPLLDVELVEAMAALPVSYKLRATTSKLLLRKVCGRLLPAATLAKPKQGFAAPVSRWFAGELRSFAEEILLDRRTLERGYFRAGTVRAILAHHASGRRDYGTWLWSLMVLELWFRLFLDAAPSSLLEVRASCVARREQGVYAL